MPTMLELAMGEPLVASLPTVRAPTVLEQALADMPAPDPGVSAAVGRLAPETRTRLAGLTDLSRKTLAGEAELLEALGAHGVSADSRTVRQQILAEARKVPTAAPSLAATGQGALEAAFPQPTVLEEALGVSGPATAPRTVLATAVEQDSIQRVLTAPLQTWGVRTPEGKMREVPPQRPEAPEVAGRAFVHGLTLGLNELAARQPVPGLPVASLATHGISALADANWWVENAAEIVGFMAGPGKLLKPLQALIGAPAAPTLGALGKMVRGGEVGKAIGAEVAGLAWRQTPFAAMMGAASSIDAAKQPDATPKTVLLAGGQGFLIGQGVAHLAGLARVPFSRLLRQPSRAMVEYATGAGARGKAMLDDLPAAAKEKAETGKIPKWFLEKYADIMVDVAGMAEEFKTTGFVRPSPYGLYGGLPVPSLKQLKAAANELGLLLPQVKRFAQVLAKGAMSVEEAARQTGVPLQAAMVLAQRFGQPERKTWTETLKEGEAGLAEVPTAATRPVEGPPEARQATPAPEAGQVPAAGVGGAPEPAKGAPAEAKQIGQMSREEYWNQPSGLGEMARTREAIDKQYNGEKTAAKNLASARDEANRIHAIEVGEAVEKGLAVAPDARAVLSEYKGESWADAALAALEAKPAPAPAPAQGKAKPVLVTPAKLTQEVGSDPGFVYHATNEERLYEIAESGRLNTHRPGAFTEQDVWPDGATEKRAYFSRKAEIVWQFSPEEGKPVLVRARETPAFKTESTGDVYSSKAVPTSQLEYLGEDGVWHPVASLATPAPATPAPAPAKGEAPTSPVSEYGKLLVEAGDAVEKMRERVKVVPTGELEAYEDRLSEKEQRRRTRPRKGFGGTLLDEPERTRLRVVRDELKKRTEALAVPKISKKLQKAKVEPPEAETLDDRRDSALADTVNAETPWGEPYRKAWGPGWDALGEPGRQSAIREDYATEAKTLAEEGAAPVSPAVRSPIPEIAAAQEADLARARANVRRAASEGGYGQPPAKQLQRAAPPAAKKIESAAPPAKEPWEMTLGEYTKQRLADARAKGVPSRLARQGLKGDHAVEVGRAVREGRAVPPGVLAEYPELTAATLADHLAETGKMAPPPPKPPAPPAAAPEPEPEPEPKPEADEAEPATAEAEAEQVSTTEKIAEVKAELRATAIRHRGKIDENRARFLAAIRKLPIHVRGKLTARGINLETTTDLIGGLELADKYFEDWLKREAIRRILKTAASIHEHRMEFDPATEADVVQEAERLRGTSKTDLMKPEPGEHPDDVLARLLKLKDRMVEGWHMHRDKTVLYTLQGMADAEDAARSVLKDLETWNPPAGVEPKGPMPGTPHRSVANRALDLNSHADTLIEGNLGPEDGVLSRVLVDNVGRNVTHHHYADWYAVYDPMNAAANEASGGGLGSEKDIRWKSEPVTFEIGGEKVASERRFWLTLRAVLKDEDATAKWLARTEAEEPEDATAVWSTRRGKVAFAFKSFAEADAFAAAFDAAEPKATAYLDKCLAALNEPSRFEKTDATHHQLFGTHIEKVPGLRMPTRYNVAAEKQRAVPNFSEASPANIVKHLGQHIARLPGGRRVSMVIGDFDNILLREAWEDGAFNAYGPTLRDAWTLMEQMVEHGEKPITLRAFLGERVGREVPDTLDRHLRYVAQSVGLSYQTMLDQAEIDPALRRVLHNAMGAAVAGFKWTPMANQIPAAFLPLADTKPMLAEDVTAAILELPSKWKETWNTLGQLRPDIRFRAELADVQQFLSPAISSPRGYGENRVWRVIKKAVAFSGRGMIRVDQSNRLVHFLAARRQLIREGKLTGEALDQAAADMAARWMYRTDAPMHSAYETPVGRAAKGSTAVASVTAFTKGRLANWQVVRRALDAYRRDKDVKKLLYKLTIALAIAGAFTTVTVAGAYLSGRKPGQGLGGVPGDFVENALGNTYGATEAIRLIRSKSAYGVQVFSSPPVAAAERVGQGLVGLRTAIEKQSGDKALAASVKLLRGSASLAGIPTDQAFNLIRFVQARGAPSRQLAKWPGLKRTAATNLMVDILGASIPSPRAVKGKMLRRKGEDPAIAFFRRLKYADALRVYALADARERALWKNILTRMAAKQTKNTVAGKRLMRSAG